MHGVLLAVVHPDNTPHGANLTFAIPVAFFVVVAAALYVRFRAPHTVPGHVAFRSSRWATGTQPGNAAFGRDAVDAAVGTHAEPAAEGQRTQPAAPGTVQSGPATQSGTATPANGATASDQAKQPSEGTEDSE